MYNELLFLEDTQIVTHGDRMRCDTKSLLFPRVFEPSATTKLLFELVYRNNSYKCVQCTETENTY